ncbi:SGNH/GDSL hydrolase family protein [Cohnella zeiphila]|uniref:SGNH/GDSL hydrolase family protein n=1 Tax=Cohnella zeiphila TaxID=2761120 RepID=A0A7X0SIS3_9BACL|nr:SGNH/GDSL hydrolase family protein [Cohnella zeiphila]MBB6729465.1 SGNH/GDSL hydrolase family protein [Cohnella zeiphila]
MTKTGYTVLFQGDSITDGARGRSEDLNHILGHGYAYLAASRLGERLASRRPKFINRGISGNRVSDLYARWNEDAFALRPDLISILIGVNDLWRTMAGEPSGVTDRFERAYRHILEETKEVLPETRLVLCEPFLLKAGATVERWDEWTSRMAAYQATVRDLAEQYGALFVPLQDAFDRAAESAEPAYWIWDGVHPTAAGHQVIADRWLSVVQANVPELK